MDEVEEKKKCTFLKVPCLVTLFSTPGESLNYLLGVDVRVVKKGDVNWIHQRKYAKGKHKYRFSKRFN